MNKYTFSIFVGFSAESNVAVEGKLVEDALFFSLDSGENFLPDCFELFEFTLLDVKIGMNGDALLVHISVNSVAMQRKSRKAAGSLKMKLLISKIRCFKM